MNGFALFFCVQRFADKEIKGIIEELADELVDEIDDIRNSKNELNQKVSQYGMFV